MQKTKKIHLIFVSLLAIILTIVFCYVTFGANFLPSKQTFLNKETLNETDTPSTLADSLNGSFDIRLNYRNGQSISPSNPVSFYDSQAYRAYWSNVQSFSISYVVSEEPPSNSADPDVPSTYDFTLTVRYLKGYLSANVFDTSDTRTFENVYSVTMADYNDFASLNYVLNIDEELEQDINWGIYQFIIDINGAEATSLYYAIEPTQVIANQPSVAYTIPSSATGSLGNHYQFYLTNYEDFQFIDERNLTWYVWGQSVDGVRYALTTDDLTNETFINLSCTNALYQSYERNGTTFDIEFSASNGEEIYGQWHVWCVYSYEGSPTPLSSNTVLVEIDEPFDYINVVYIIAGIAGFSLIVTIIICVIKNKRERVW